MFLYPLILHCSRPSPRSRGGAVGDLLSDGCCCPVAAPVSCVGCRTPISACHKTRTTKGFSNIFNLGNSWV